MTVLQDPIKNAIWHCLNHYAYKDAMFLAERLYSEVATDEAMFLLATSYYRYGKPKVAQRLLEKHGVRQPECKLLYAKACWDLEHYTQAENALTGGSIKFKSIMNIVSSVQAEFGDSSCFALSLLGCIYRHTEREEWAEYCFTTSLKLNPFLWSSFEQLCEAGNKPNVDELFPPVQSEFKSPYITSFNASLQQTPQIVQQRRKKGNTVKILAPSQVGSNTDRADSIPALSTTPIQMQAADQGHACQTSPSLEDSRSVERIASCKDGDETNSDFLRSTPSETKWDSSLDSYTGLTSRKKNTRTQQRIARSLMGGPAALSPLTPSFGVMPLVETPSPAWDRSVAMITPTDTTALPMDINPPVKKMITRQSRKNNELTNATGKLLFSSENSRRSQEVQGSTTEVPSSVTSSRRSTRNYPNSGSSVKENAKKSTRVKQAQPKDVLKRNTRLRHTKPLTSDGTVRDLSEEINKVDSSSENPKPTTNPTSMSHVLSAQKSAIDGLMSLLRDMGKALVALCHYDCRRAISCIESLPANQRATCWSLSLLSKAYFEMTEYKKAARTFSELRSQFPHQVSGLALYSTTLWHLQDNIALSTLAHDVRDLDPFSPETWCCIGNCFSLRRDNENAIKFFARAVQLAPRYAYAHTLLGHEYAYSDDNERAMASYRRAIHCDRRHYNAWYGIGSIYYKQENFSLAEIHFKKALSINQRSSVLLCHLGIVQHAQKRSSIALETLANALSLEPRNPLCKFHRAMILFATEQHQDALKELLELKQIVPKESLIYFLIGKVYKVLGENHLAMMNFSWALDLDPKGINNHIKEAIDKQQSVDDCFDSSHLGNGRNTDESSSTVDIMNSIIDEVESTEQEMTADSDESL
uniref:Cell division cycle protein 27 homolog n=1 Tax=Ciona savignyi TaxID=51511 RepID=H2ZI35_CIOSA